MSAALALSLSPIQMPEREWLAADDICAKAKITDRSLRRYAASGKVISRELPQRGRNGKPVRQYLVASLPQELRHKLTPPRPAVIEMRLPEPSREIAPLFADVAPTPSAPRVSLDPKAAAQAKQRYDLIEPLLHYAHPANKGRYAGCRLADGTAVRTADQLAQYIAETQTAAGNKVSRPTLWRWVKAYKAGDTTALARKVREDKGTSHFFSRYPEAAQLAASIWLKPAATYQRAWEAIRRDRVLLGIAAHDLPSYETVRNYCDTIPRPVADLHRHGLGVYNERHAPFLRRAYTDMAANEVWVSDIQTHDVEVRNDCFPGLPANAPLRLKFVCIMDMRSRKIVGYCWCVDGDWRAIATALRRAVHQYGPCKTFYCDNGSDFGKVAAGATHSGPRRRKLSPAQAQAALDGLQRNGPLRQLDIEVTLCIAYNAQAKPVERLFAFVHGQLDAIWIGYLTGKTSTRPDAAIVMGVEHRKLAKQGLGHASMLPPASAFIRLATEWIENVYNAQHAHSGQGMDGKTPNAVYDALYPLQSRTKADPAVLDMLLFERDSRKVDANAIRLTVGGQKLRYVPRHGDDQAAIALHYYGGRTVTIAYDALAPDTVIVLDDRDCKVCELVPETLTTQTSSSTALATQTSTQIGAMVQTRNRLKKATYAGVHQVDRAVALRGHKTELQTLVDAALTNPSPDVDSLLSHKALRAATRPDQTAKAPESSYDIANELLGDLL